MASAHGEQFDLRPWQIAAKAEWVGAGRRGIVAAATGTGKTRLAAAALGGLDQGWVTVVVVPTKALQSQWIQVLARLLAMRPDRIGTVGGDAPQLTMEQRVIVAVLNSARDRIPPLVNHWHSAGLKVLLVVDECHRAGAPDTASALWSVEYDATLGLSATPERGDDGLDDILIPRMGEVVYRYSLVSALDDGLLAPLAVANIYVDLDALSLSEYQRLEQRVRDQLAAGLSADAPVIKRIRTEQAQVIRRAGGRTAALKSLVRGGLVDGRRTLIFHETIEQATMTAEVLDGAGISHSLEHSKLSSETRATSLRRFANGAVDCLVTVRALDEGIDVPDANLALICSGTMNPRQRIQRAGRVVRPSGDSSLVVSLLTNGTSEETVVGTRDSTLFGATRVNHIANWNAKDASALVSFLRTLK